MSDFRDDHPEDVVDLEADEGDIRERVSERVEEREEGKGLFEHEKSGDEEIDAGEEVDAGEEDSVEDDGE